MAGMNLIFHVVAALACLLLLFALIHVRAQRDFLRALIREVANDASHKRLIVDAPQRFLRRFAAAWGLDYVVDPGLKQVPCRIDPEPLVWSYLRLQIVRIRFGQDGVELQVRRAAEDPASLIDKVSRALGGIAVMIVVLEAGSAAALGSDRSHQ